MTIRRRTAGWPIATRKHRPRKGFELFGETRANVSVC